MPGYTSDLYNYIVGLYPTFKNDVSLEQFKSKMSDTGYSKNMYDWVGQNDKTFHSDVSFDAFREKLGYKKKGPTVLPSVQKPAPISSGTQPKVTQKPSGTSVSGKPEGLYSFPGNTLAVFKKTADGWYVDNTRSGNFIKLQKGDVEKRTAALEKQAQTLYDKDYEKSLSWKWERQPEVAEPKKQQTNEQKQQQELFKNTFKALKEDDPIVIEKENVSKLSKDVSSYVDKSEGETVEDLTNKFKNTKYDIFNFEETGVGDMLKVTNKKTGQNITIDLDGSENEKKILESFMYVL